ncbi:MAG: hypothetical protein Q9187_002969 [Circinaria calcarea]
MGAINSLEWKTYELDFRVVQRQNAYQFLSAVREYLVVGGSNSARGAGGPIPLQKPEDKDSPEYKKKQAMLNGPILPMNYDNAASYGMSESLFTSLKDIFEAIVANPSRTGVVSPAKFLEVLKKENEMFRTSMHQDAHEFLNLLLNEVVANVETDAKKIDTTKGLNSSGEHDGFGKTVAEAMPITTGARSPSTTGWVHELFEGTLTSETKCLTCENVSQRDEAFLDLSVDLDQHSSVTSCLRKFSEEEMLCERNKFHCDKCGGLQEAEKRMKIKRLPKILALHLKRFKYTEDLQRLQKLFHRVVYPYHLRLFNTTDDAEDPDRLYELYAVVVHIGGGPYHGHYVTIIKTQDRGWLLFDDEMVEPVDKSYVRNFFGERPGLACAYVLFYQETTLEAVKKEQEAEGLAAATQATAVPKEPVGLGLKTNGIPMANGIHQSQSAISPPASPTEDREPWESLAKSATVPPLVSHSQPSPPSSPPPTIGPSVASTPHTQMEALSPKNGFVHSKKERAKEEKERKAAEKEAEKADRARRKNEEVRRREQEKRQEKDLKAAMEVSKASKAEEDRRLASDKTTAGYVPKENGASTETKPDTKGGGTLGRFRQGSKSIRSKPKFWGSRDGTPRGEDATVAVVDGERATDGGETTPAQTPEKLEKKNRFSVLRKKTSAMLL